MKAKGFYLLLHINSTYNLFAFTPQNNNESVASVFMNVYKHFHTKHLTIDWLRHRLDNLVTNIDTNVLTVEVEKWERGYTIYHVLSTSHNISTVQPNSSFCASIAIVSKPVNNNYQQSVLLHVVRSQELYK